MKPIDVAGNAKVLGMSISVTRIIALVDVVRGHPGKEWPVYIMV